MGNTSAKYMIENFEKEECKPYRDVRRESFPLKDNMITMATPNDKFKDSEKMSILSNEERQQISN
jgi:hypothetical protein